MVDATYRSDLRELNELNYAGFEAKARTAHYGAQGRNAGRVRKSDLRFRFKARTTRDPAYQALVRVLGRAGGDDRSAGVRSRQAPALKRRPQVRQLQRGLVGSRMQPPSSSSPRAAAA